MRGVSRKIMAGLIPRHFLLSMRNGIHMAEDKQNAAYENALRQLDELIAHLRSSEEVSCAVAEQEDLMLIRLADLKIDLRPNDEKAIADIDRFYRRHLGDGK